MMEAGYQAKTVCVNMQLCASLKAGIEGETHALGKQILDRSRERHREEEARIREEEEEESESVAVGIENLNIDTEGASSQY